MTIRPKILVVEDERIVAEDIQKSLIQLGYQVVGVVASGEAAIETAKQESPDLVLMDIVIQGDMNGIETADIIRERCHIPVIYLTAYADAGTLEKAKRTEPYGYILKPFEDRELHSTIEMGLYKHRTEKKLQESEAWLATILRSIGDGVIVTDLEGQLTFMNPMAELMVGWNSEEAVGKPLNSVVKLFDEETNAPIHNPVKGVLKHAGEKSQSRQNILINRQGVQLIVRESGAPIRDDFGEITGVVLILHDITERRKTEKELQKITHEESVLLNSVPALISLMDKKSNFVRVNSAFAATLKKSTDEIHGKNIFDLYPSKLATVYHEDNLKVIHEKVPHRNVEEPLETPDGTMWVKSDRLPYVDENGNVMGIIGLSTDITDRKKAEIALKKSEERYRGLFETMRQGVLYFDQANRVLASNRASEEIFEINHAEMRNKSLIELFSGSVTESGDRLDLSLHPVLQTFHSNQPVTNVVLGVRSAKGKRKWILMDSSPAFISGEEMASVFCTFTDITLRKEAEFFLLKRNVQLQSLNTISSAVGGTLSLTKIMKTALNQVMQLAEFKGGILFLFNKSRTAIDLEVHYKIAEEMVSCFTDVHIRPTHYRKQLLKGRTNQYSVAQLFEEHVSDCPKAFSYCLTVPIKEGKRVVGSLNVFKKEITELHQPDLTFFNNIGSHIGLAVRNARLYEETNDALNELKITQDKLIQSEKLAVLGGLTSSVVHEIGNPLAAIMNSVDVLKRRVKLEGRLKELMDIIGWETERLDRTIDQLREFSKPRRLHFQLGNIEDVVKQTIVVLNQDLKLILGRKILTRFGKNIPLVIFDSDALEQVVLNLTKNALQAVDEGGEVLIQMQLHKKNNQDWIAIKVLDNGPGISDEALERLFEPYFTTKARGMGLGMHIVKQIVEAHGGTIHAVNRKTIGASFTVFIPANREENG